jgi:hypothetical protein
MSVPNGQIWATSVVTTSEPTPAQNGGSGRVLLELLDHSV